MQKMGRPQWQLFGMFHGTMEHSTPFSHLSLWIVGCYCWKIQSKIGDFAKKVEFFTVNGLIAQAFYLLWAKRTILCLMVNDCSFLFSVSARRAWPQRQRGSEWLGIESRSCPFQGPTPCCLLWSVQWVDGRCYGGSKAITRPGPRIVSWYGEAWGPER